MQRFKPAEEDLGALSQAATNLREANAAAAAAKKAADTAKQFLNEWLKKKRGLELESLKIGDVISIDGVALIQIGKQNRFDEDAFAMVHPLMHASYKKDFPVKKFSPLV